MLNIPIRIIFNLSMLITFCLFFEYARNSSIFDLNGVYSVNNTLSPTPVPARLRCVISLVDYLLLCVVNRYFYACCVLIFISCAMFFTFFTPVYVCFFVDFFITKLYSSLFFFKINSKNHYLLFCRKPLFLCVFIPNGFPHIFFTKKC
jgi:hypothetical protein